MGKYKTFQSANRKKMLIICRESKTNIRIIEQKVHRIFADFKSLKLLKVSRSLRSCLAYER